MFAEYASESPRVPSPWDPFLPSPYSEPQLRTRVPKLVPELQEGNVEYKLKLTNISPARFARLVTQLKWRLLEGGGQAYYELGVADSGALIGLSRADLEQSLQSLEIMAGEIGASVIVVKEIQVPPIMFALTDEASKYLDPHTGEWTRKMTSKRRTPAHFRTPDDDLASAASATETETETETELESTADLAEFDHPYSAASSHLDTPADSQCPSPCPAVTLPYAHRLSSHPSRPTAQSSPFIAPIDDDLALFSMEPEPPYCVDEPGLLSLHDAAAPFDIDIGIASVYKPRPTRRRSQPPAATTATATAFAQEKPLKSKEKAKKIQPWHTVPPGTKDGDLLQVPNRQESKAAMRRVARDRRREDRRLALLAGARDRPVVTDGAAAGITVDNSATGPATGSRVALEEQADEPQTAALVATLDALHLAVQATSPTDVDLPASTNDGGGDTDDARKDVLASAGREPRLIVEALVVRKMSIEEAFLDFGGFSLL